MLLVRSDVERQTLLLRCTDSRGVSDLAWPRARSHQRPNLVVAHATAPFLIAMPARRAPAGGIERRPDSFAATARSATACRRRMMHTSCQRDATGNRTRAFQRGTPRAEPCSPSCSPLRATAEYQTITRRLSAERSRSGCIRQWIAAPCDHQGGEIGLLSRCSIRVRKTVETRHRDSQYGRPCLGIAWPCARLDGRIQPKERGATGRHSRSQRLRACGCLIYTDVLTRGMLGVTSGSAAVRPGVAAAGCR